MNDLWQNISNWLQDDVDEQHRKEFNDYLYRFNLERLLMITGMAIFFFFLLGILDLLRLADGLFEDRFIYSLLFFTHVMLLLFILPALFVQQNPNSIWYGFRKHRRLLFISCLVVLAFSILPMAVISLQLRGSVIMLAIYAIAINVGFKLPRATSFWLNLASIILITAAIIWVQSDELASTVWVNIIEFWAIMIGVFMLSIDQFNFEVKRFNYEKLLEEQNKVIQSSLKEEFNKKITEIETTALRAQMNPHFLFNVLNSIKYYMVQNDARTASRYLTKFARLIRLILNNSKSHMVQLDDELKALELYIEMENFRFNDKFDYEIVIADEIETEQIEIPPLILQPYVENAIWHGLMHKEDGRGKLQVKVLPSEEDERTIRFIIEDNGIGREKAAVLKTRSATRHKSVGTKITQDRIEMTNKLYDIKASVKIIDLKDEFTERPLGTRIVVHLPIPSKISAAHPA